MTHAAAPAAARATFGVRPRPVAPPDDPPTARPTPSYLGGAR
jgi:hypothetical protein